LPCFFSLATALIDVLALLTGNMLLRWDFRFMIGGSRHSHIVAQQAVLTRRARCGRSGRILDRAEIDEVCGCPARSSSDRRVFSPRGFFKDMAGQTPAILQDADALADPDRLEVRFMDEIGEAAPFAFDRRRGEIDEAPSAFHVVDAVTFRA
jgi:hypothetical protein